MKLAFALAVTLLVAACVPHAAPPDNSSRALSEVEVDAAVGALLAAPLDSLSEDPSCRSDLSLPGSMSIAEGLSVALVRAVTEADAVLVVVDCVERGDFPLQAGEEVCRLNFTRPSSPHDYGYGLVFVMDWPAQRVRPGSVECF